MGIYTGTKGKLKASGVEWVCEGKPLDDAKKVIIKTKTVPPDTYSISEEDLTKASDITSSPPTVQSTPTETKIADPDDFYSNLTQEQIADIVARGGFVC